MTDSKQIQFPIKELCAIRVFASEDESRYILNSVRVEVEQHSAMLVATDGRTLGVMLATLEPDLFPRKWSVVIPASAIDSIAKSVSKDALVSVSVVADEITLSVGSDKDCVTVVCQAMPGSAGNYLDWRNVV